MGATHFGGAKKRSASAKSISEILPNRERSERVVLMWLKAMSKLLLGKSEYSHNPYKIVNFTKATQRNYRKVYYI
jgi:hypothetical protein